MFGTTHGNWKLQHLDFFTKRWEASKMVIGQKVAGNPNRIRWYNLETGCTQYKPVKSSRIAPPEQHS